MELVKYFSEKKMELAPLQFLRDVIKHEKIKNMDSYEQKKQIALFRAAQAEMAGGLEIGDIYKKEITELIIRRHGNLSINELYYAFKLDRFGEFEKPTPHYGNFNTQYVAQVLRKYSDWRQKVRYDHKLPISAPETTTEITDDEKKLILYEGVMEEFDHYKNARMIRDGKTYIYDLLAELGKLPPKLSEEAIERGRQFLKDSLLLEKSNAGISATVKLRQMIAEIEEKKSSKVVIASKKLEIGAYFRKTKREDLDKLLTDKL